MGGRLPTVSDEEILAIFEEAEHPLLGPRDVLEALQNRQEGDIGTYEGAKAALDRLADQGDLYKQKVSGVWVYVHPERVE